MLDVKRLQVLLSVVELGSVTAAADALVYTPSAVSQQLRRLEREVGQPLLRRHARGMSPTDAGLVLAAHARMVLRRLSAAEADLAEIAGLRQGRLALGTFPTVASGSPSSSSGWRTAPWTCRCCGTTSGSASTPPSST